MEPLSTVALLVSLTLPATAIPNLSSDKTKKHGHVLTSIINKDLYYDDPAMESTVADLTMPHSKELPVATITNDVISQLGVYSDLEPGWDGPGSLVPSFNDIELAIDFIGSIPAVFPLPKAMLSSDGIVGLYWDDDLIYIDIQFESDRTISMFSRNRSSGKERFIDSIDVAIINPNWFFDTLGELLSPAEELLAA